MNWLLLFKIYGLLAALLLFVIFITLVLGGHVSLLPKKRKPEPDEEEEEEQE